MTVIMIDVMIMIIQDVLLTGIMIKFYGVIFGRDHLAMVGQIHYKKTNQGEELHHEVGDEDYDEDEDDDEDYDEDYDDEEEEGFDDEEEDGNEDDHIQPR